MKKIKLVELYTVMIILCAAVLFFGLFQMQSGLNAVLNQEEFSSFQFALQGVQIASIGLIIGTVVVFIFFKRLNKKHKDLKEITESKKKN